MIRAYVDPNSQASRLDFDLILKDDTGNVVATSLNVGTMADQIVYRLKEKTTYTLQVHLATFGGRASCTSFGFEMAVEPVPADLWAGPCFFNDMPPANFLSSLNRPWDFTRTFSFTQRIGVSNTFELNLDLQVASFFRAQISYEFIWGALSLTLRDSNTLPIIMGTGGSNSNNLGALRLAPGNYTLVIKHSSIPFAVGSGPDTSSRCAAFTLHAAIDDADNDEVLSGEENPCRLTGLPASMSSAASAHPLSGNSFHLTRHVLIDTVNRRDATVFTLTEQSLFRVFVPALEFVDVDMSLVSAQGSHVFDVTNVGENARVRRLDAGSYTLFTRYFPQMGSVNNSLPQGACLWFPLQLELMPMTRVLASPAHFSGTNCEVGTPPSSLSAGSYSNDYSHALGGGAPAFLHNMTLHLSTVSVLRMTVDSQFATGYVWFRVFRGSDSAMVKPLLPVMSDSGAFFNDELEPGDWTVQLYHPVGDDTNPAPAELTCNVFTLSYSLSESVNPSSCHLVPLPTDVSMVQQSNGAFFLSGDSFRSPGRSKKSYVSFLALGQNSLVWRALAQSNGNAEIDIDFVLYKNASLSTIIRSFTMSGTLENAFAILGPQPEAYVLEITVFSLRYLSSTDCASIFFSMAAEPFNTVNALRQCPVVLPANTSDAYPPTILSIPVGATSFSYPAHSYILSRAMLAPFTTRYRPARDTSTTSPTLLMWWKFDINLEIREETTVRLSAASNFLSSEVHLASQYGVRGSYEAQPHSGSRENFRTTLSKTYSAGLHKVTVYGQTQVSDYLAAGVLANSESCLRFSLDVSLTQTGSLTAPRFVGVVPDGSAPVNAAYLGQVVVTADHLIDVPSVATFQQQVISGSLVYVVDSAAPSVKIAPTSATLDAARLRMVFGFPSFQPNRTYQFGVDSGKFFSAGVAFESRTWPLIDTHVCSCNQFGHGYCKDDYYSSCVCDQGYAGFRCSGCATGYHGAGGVCVPNMECSPNQCGGNGNCSSVHGFPECSCFPGYETVGQSPCSACSSGYETDPSDSTKCVPSDDEESANCGLSLLPASLNGPGFLGFDGSCHLSGRYFLDVPARRHPVKFTLSAPSVFRVYVEPHKVDVDISLHFDAGDGTPVTETIAGSYAFVGEEVIFVTLQPGSYVLVFYYVGGFNAGKFGLCESAKIEISVKPKDVVMSSNNNLQDKCDEAIPGGDVFKQTILNDTQKLLELQEDVSLVYKPQTLFAVPAVDPSPPSSGRRVIASAMFITPRANMNDPTRQVPLLTVELSYRFESGDLGLILETGAKANSPLTCSSSAERTCLVGTNGYDRNSIRAFLSPNTAYTLWIYEPVKQNTELSKCSLFQFSFELDWRQPVASDELGCAGAQMPDVILDDGTGVHWQQDIGVTSEAQNTTIQVGAGGKRLRLSAALTPNDGDVLAVGADVVLYKDNVEFSAIHANDDGIPQEMLVVLNPGTYVLSVGVAQLLDNGQESTRCWMLNLELALESATLGLPSSADLGCPSNGRPVLPVFPVPLSEPFDLPFENEAGEVRTYFTYRSTGTFMEVPFTVSEESVLVASMWSSFFASSGTLKVHQSDSLLEALATSVPHYNEARLNGVQLSPGSYVLRASIPSALSGMPCIPFNFRFHLQRLVEVNAATPLTNPRLATLSCESQRREGYDHLPSSLNTWKFLAFDGRVDIHSYNVLLPVESQVSRSTVRQTKLRVAIKSVLRLSLESVETVSQVFAFFSLIRVNDSSVITQQNSQAFQVLDANVDYVLNWTIVHYNADPVIPEGSAPWCKVIGAHLSIVPYAWAISGPALCEGSASKLPHGPLTPPGVPSKISPFTTGSLTTYYLQQSSSSGLSQQMDLRLDGPSNVLVEVLFDFADMDLRVSLLSVGTREYFKSQLSSTGSFLLVTGLEAGSYVLTLVENHLSSGSPEFSRCRPFLFRVTVERDEAKYRTLRGSFSIPETLDDVGYLNYDGTAHFAHEFDLENVNLADKTKISEFTNVSVTADSLLSVHMRLVNEDEEDEMVPVFSLLNSNNIVIASSTGSPQLSFDYVLTSGAQYRLGWSAHERDVQGLSPSRDVQMFVEISVVPLTILSNKIQANAAYHASACGNGMKLPQIVANDGYFMFAKEDFSLPSTSQGALSTTFTLLDESVVYVAIENQFALAHLSLMLAPLSSNSTESPAVSRSDRNRRWLHQVLDAGDYVLSLVPHAVSANAPAHCTVVSLHVSVRPAWQGVASHMADCTALNLLPRNLSNPMPFGGPINGVTGELVVYGDKFLYPERVLGGSDMSYSFSQLTLPSLKSMQLLLFVQVDMAFYSRSAVEFELLVFNRLSVPSDVRAYADQSLSMSRMSRYRMQEAVAAVVQMGFPHNWAESVSGTCPYYTFGTYALNSDLLASSLLCTTKQQSALVNKPSSTAVVNANGTYYEHSYGFLSSLTVLSDYTISFNVTQISILHYSMSINAFASDVIVRLTRLGNDRRVGSATLLPAYQDHFVNARTFGTEYLPAGNYIVNFVHTSLAKNAGLTNSRGQTLSGAG